MYTISKFGEKVEGYNIPVLNQREIRAAAGILFLMMFISVMIVILKENFVLIKYAISLFIIDLSIRVFISPRYAPTLIIARMIIRNQTPEYVGAQQKQFAWIIGLVMASIFFYFLIIENTVSPITGLLCLSCLIFLFFETAFGICIGCKLYSLFYKNKAQHCPGEVCDPQTKHAIQKISNQQVFALIMITAIIIATIFFFNDALYEYLSKRPFGLPDTVDVN